ncbi:tellurite resistance TerB family protein [Anaeromicrobium sediminis]|uniref:Co-chaperone DjlA N-terminal domain-containing protein n=1 Tax=Anaeromicrobium sediminis TaxID=1478221 RepID=A0A267MDR8_9FIRM|nr:TerB family tellurite resistance protein [Anaeromicrobium sediminis]PAB57731.1 hypothetical protein CCE28_18070 [Anaeromicrobium sediminis]
MAFFSLGRLMDFKKGAKKFNNKDFLQAVCGVCCAVAYADGSCSDEEMATMQALIMNDESLSEFTPGEIEIEIERHSKNFKLNQIVGELNAKKAVKGLGGTEQKEMTVAIALAVAGADGKIDDSEVKVIKKFASEMGVSTRAFGI